LLARPAFAEAPIARGSIFDRLRDDAGAVPGLAGVTLIHRDDPQRCGGIAVRAVRRSRIAADGARLAKVIFYDELPELDFSPARFEKWRRELQKIANDAVARYTDVEAATRDGKGQPTDDSVEARARVVQSLRFAAAKLARARIPADVRSGAHTEDNVESYCTTLADHARVLLDRADKIATWCRDEQVDNYIVGWSRDVCARAAR
jgi:hypothetical protein